MSASEPDVRVCESVCVCLLYWLPEQASSDWTFNLYPFCCLMDDMTFGFIIWKWVGSYFFFSILFSFLMSSQFLSENGFLDCFEDGLRKCLLTMTNSRQFFTFFVNPTASNVNSNEGFSNKRNMHTTDSFKKSYISFSKFMHFPSHTIDKKNTCHPYTL